MDHAKVAGDLILRAQYLSSEFVISEFQVKLIIDGDDESFISFPKNELESRIRGYIYEGFSVSVDILDHKVTVEVVDS